MKKKSPVVKSAPKKKTTKKAKEKLDIYKDFNHNTRTTNYYVCS